MELKLEMGWPSKTMTTRQDILLGWVLAKATSDEQAKLKAKE